MVSTSDFYACPVNSKNIRFLPALINGQAKHHHSKFIGTTSKLRQDFLKAAQPTANIQLIYHRKMGLNPIGYMAFNETITENGAGLYLEDIFVQDHVRQHVRGAGSYGFHQLIDTALKGQMSFVQWAVAMNNEPATFYFYENKIGANRLDKELYDIDHVLQNGMTPVLELINTHFTVKRADKSDLRALRASIDSYNNHSRHPLSVTTDDLIDRIKDAITHHNADVYICRDDRGGIKALNFINSNYSTFRTVTGIKAEPMIALTDDALEYQQALWAIMHKVREDAHSTDRTGHLVWTIKSTDSLGHRLMNTQNAEILQMEAHNIASTLVMYGIKDQNISTSKRDSLIPKP